MNKASEPILELLEYSDVALPPSAIVVNLNRMHDDSPARSTIYRAFDGLLENGLIRTLEIDGTYYVITDLGRAYLNGELTDSELKELRDSE